MNVTIRINCDNEAFEGRLGSEVARILRIAAKRLDGNAVLYPYDGFSLRDVNGNLVGHLDVTEGE